VTTTTTTREQRPLELPIVRGPNRGGLAFGFLLAVLAAAVLAVAFVLGLAQAYDGRVMPGVRVGSVDLAGLDRSQAETRLRESLPSLSTGHLTLRFGDETRVVPYATIGRDYDMAAMLDAAYGVGRAGALPERIVDELRTLFRGTALQPIARFDQAALNRQVATAAASLERAPADASVALAADGSFAVTAGTDGVAIDEAAGSTSAFAALTGLDPADVALDVPTQAVAPAVTSDEARTAAARATAMSATDVPLVIDETSHAVPASVVRTWLYFGTTPDGQYLVSAPPSRIRGWLEGMTDKVDRAPRNASFTIKNGKVTGVVAGVDGRKLDIPTTAQGVNAALMARADGAAPPPVQLAVTATAPNLTSEEAAAFVPKMRSISQWTTNYVVNEKNFFGKNISIPTSVINGYVVAPGEWFDFWDAIGEVSRRTGYGAGGAIINGKTEPTGALAGGICSCSTTLFNAAARAGLEMGARRNHYYYINRYPVGLDATVFKSSSGSVQTMSFRNDTPYPVLIRGINSYGKVTFQIYSVPNGRKVSFSNPIIRNKTQATDSVVYTSSLPPGASKRVEYPVDGMDVSVTRTVRDASGKVIHQETYHSHYARITGILQVGR
jgi:vancomycin resistance protein YoaR